MNPFNRNIKIKYLFSVNLTSPGHSWKKNRHSSFSAGLMPSIKSLLLLNYTVVDLSVLLMVKLREHLTHSHNAECWVSSQTFFFLFVKAYIQVVQKGLTQNKAEFIIEPHLYDKLMKTAALLVWKVKLNKILNNLINYTQLV